MVFYNISLLNKVKELKQVSIEELSKEFGYSAKREINVLSQLNAIKIENNIAIYIGEPDKQRL